jgi:hypothetical protein
MKEALSGIGDARKRNERTTELIAHTSSVLDYDRAQLLEGTSRKILSSLKTIKEPSYAWQ